LPFADKYTKFRFILDLRMTLELELEEDFELHSWNFHPTKRNVILLCVKEKAP
jgi:hypothetical protein